jgi:hypothetical protein
MYIGTISILYHDGTVMGIPNHNVDFKGDV